MAQQVLNNGESGLIARTKINENTTELYSLNSANVKTFGAVGDGITDDTDAIYLAIADAKTNGNGVVYFPQGTYLITRALFMSSNMQFVGASGATITKPLAVTQTLQAQVEIGDTTLEVSDGSAFTVGYDIYFHDMTDISPANGTNAVITDITGNIITFDSYRSEGSKSQEPIGSVVTQSFPMITTSAFIEDAENIIINNLTLDGNKAVDEPHAWVIAPIHIDPQSYGPYKQKYNRIINNTVQNSATDGISTQAGQDIWIQNNRVIDCVGKGIHIGTTIDKVFVDHNVIERCEDCGMFYCYGITKVTFTNNILVDNAVGINGLDVDGDETIISNNIFQSNRRTHISMSGCSGAVINNNVFRQEYDTGNGITIIEAYNSNNILINDNMCVVYGNDLHYVFSFIKITGGNYINICDNYLDLYNDGVSSVDTVIDVVPLGATPSKNINIIGNIIKSGKGAVDLENVEKCIINDNQMQTVDGTWSVRIDSDCADILLNNNIIEAQILDEGTRTIINDVCQGDFGGLLPDPRNFISGTIVIDTSNDQILQLENDGVSWFNITNNKLSSLEFQYQEGTENVTFIEGYDPVPLGTSLTKGASYMDVYCDPITYSGAELSVISQTQIDLTDVDLLYIDWELFGDYSGYDYVYFYATDDATGETYTLFLTNRHQFGRKWSTLDVSTLSGNYYIGVNIDPQAVNTLRIYNIGYLDLTKSNVIDLPLGEEYTPASATATGVKGQVKWDNGYLYVCVDTDTWKRAAIATW